MVLGVPLLWYYYFGVGPDGINIGVLSCPHSGWMDFDQTCTDTLFCKEKELIRF